MPRLTRCRNLTRRPALRGAAAPALLESYQLAVLAGNVAPSSSGMPIRDAAGLLLGALGISGDTGDADEAAAVAGIAAAGLTAQPGN